MAQHAARAGALPPIVPFVSGFGALAVALVAIMLVPVPTPAQAVVVAAVLGLAAACIATGFLGSIEVNTKIVKATGASGIFVLVFYIAIRVCAPGVSFYPGGAS
jgi:hypothetical protein